jgi:hypothetical protein
MAGNVFENFCACAPTFVALMMAVAILCEAIAWVVLPVP